MADNDVLGEKKYIKKEHDYNICDYIFFVVVSVCAFVGLALSTAAYTRSLRTGFTGKTGIQGQEGSTGAQGSAGPDLYTPYFIYNAVEQDSIPLDEFYTIPFTLGILNSTSFNGTHFIVQSNGTYNFIATITLDFIVPSLETTTFDIFYSVNSNLAFGYTSTLYDESNSVSIPASLIWYTSLNEGDAINIVTLIYGYTGLRVNIDQETSTFSGFKLA